MALNLPLPSTCHPEKDLLVSAIKRKPDIRCNTRAFVLFLDMNTSCVLACTADICTLSATAKWTPGLPTMSNSHPCAVSLPLQGGAAGFAVDMGLKDASHIKSLAEGNKVQLV